MLLNDRGEQAAGGGRERDAGVRLSAAQWLGRSRRRAALHRRLPGARLGHDGDHGSRVSDASATPARRRRSPRDVVADGQGRPASLRQSPLDPRRPPTRSTTPSRAGTTSEPTSTAHRSSKPMAHPGSIGSCRAARIVSKDGRSVFVGVPGIKPVMQMRIGWTLASAAGGGVAGQRIVHAL